MTLKLATRFGLMIALVSDAGMPAICDPGSDMVRLALAENKNRPIFAVIPAAILTCCIPPALPNSLRQNRFRFSSSSVAMTFLRYVGSLIRS